MQKDIEQKISEALLTANLQSRDDLCRFKRQIAKKYKLPILKNSDLLEIYHKLPTKKRVDMEMILRKRPIRSLSGIVNVSVLTKPWHCPGKCIFCPNEKNLPKSYLAKEPAVQRAIANNFDPYKQVAMRLSALRATGHPTDKVELRIIGGTWSAYPRKYQEWFVGECFRACNEFLGYSKAPSALQACKALGAFHNFQFLQQKNERAKTRIVGIAVETRPEYITADEIKFMRGLGITKVELGVQSIYDDVLRLNKRGHNVATTITATRLLKNAGFKVSYQMMPGLYGSSFKRDVAMFREIFINPDFKPDYLKIYPLALVKNTGLYNLYKQGKFKPYKKNQLCKLLIEIKKQIPYWCRVERIIRDIPPEDIIEGGSNILNMREIIAREMQKQGIKCKCVRCREVGADIDIKEKIYLFREDYQARDGQEIFLSYATKNQEKLFGLLRLRLSPKPSSPAPSALCNRKALGAFQLPSPSVALIRDLHIYGQMAQLVRGQTSYTQHKGLGKKLLAQAEKIAKQNGFSKIAVISGVGVRPYYRKLGYRLQNTYMKKTLN